MSSKCLDFQPTVISAHARRPTIEQNCSTTTKPVWHYRVLSSRPNQRLGLKWGGLVRPRHRVEDCGCYCSSHSYQLSCFFGKAQMFLSDRGGLTWLLGIIGMFLIVSRGGCNGGSTHQFLVLECSLLGNPVSKPIQFNTLNVYCPCKLQKVQLLQEQNASNKNTPVCILIQHSDLAKNHW